MPELVGSTTVAANQSSIEKAIVAHAKENFSLSADEIALKAIDSKTLPGGVSQYYLEKKSSYGNISYNYIVYNDKIFCSGIETDFGNFLKERDFLRNKDLDDQQFLALYRTLRSKRRDILIIDKAKIADDESLKLYQNQIMPPRLTFNGNEALLIFYTKKVAGMAIEKFEVKVSPSYTVTVQNSKLQPAT